jgi:hypothetical protein
MILRITYIGDGGTNEMQVNSDSSYQYLSNVFAQQCTRLVYVIGSVSAITDWYTCNGDFASECTMHAVSI